MPNPNRVAGAATPPMPDRTGAAVQKAPPKSTSRGREKAKQVDARANATRAQAESSEELFTRVDEDQPYVRPTSTEAPKERAGMKQRWVRVGLAPNIDEKNLQRRLREGWRARHTDTVPKTFHIPRVKHGRFTGTVMVEGLILMEMPMKLARKREAAIREMTKIRTDAVNQNLMRLNQAAGGGFGPVRKAEKSVTVREVPLGKDSGGEEETDLTT